MTRLDDAGLDRLLSVLADEPDRWRLQILRRRILLAAAERKKRSFFRWYFEPALVAAMLLGFILGDLLPLDRLYDDQATMVSILQLSDDQFSGGG